MLTDCGRGVCLQSICHADGVRLGEGVTNVRLASERAALIYQHESRGADQAIADAIDRQLRFGQGTEEDDDGSYGAPVPVG